jgi:hypothetical protein
MVKRSKKVNLLKAKKAVLVDVRNNWKVEACGNSQLSKLGLPPRDCQEFRDNYITHIYKGMKGFVMAKGSSYSVFRLENHDPAQYTVIGNTSIKEDDVT